MAGLLSDLNVWFFHVLFYLLFNFYTHELLALYTLRRGNNKYQCISHWLLEMGTIFPKTQKGERGERKWMDR